MYLAALMFGVLAGLNDHARGVGAAKRVAARGSFEYAFCCRRRSDRRRLRPRMRPGATRARLQHCMRAVAWGPNRGAGGTAASAGSSRPIQRR